MNEWKQRLKQAREAKGLNKTEFSKLVGVSNPTVTDWEKAVEDGGIKEISGSKLTRVCDVLGIDANWLLHGREPANDRPNVFDLVPGAKRVRAVDADDPSMTQIMKVTFRVQAGITGFQVEPEPYEGDTQAVPTQWIETKGFHKDGLLATIVRGESMEPALYDGDVIVVNTRDVQLADGQVFVVNYEGEAIVKRLMRDAGQWWLTSDNADQRKYHRKLCKGAECIVIGRVVRKESTHI